MGFRCSREATKRDGKKVSTLACNSLLADFGIKFSSAYASMMFKPRDTGKEIQIKILLGTIQPIVTTFLTYHGTHGESLVTKRTTLSTSRLSNTKYYCIFIKTTK